MVLFFVVIVLRLVKWGLILLFWFFFGECWNSFKDVLKFLILFYVVFSWGLLFDLDILLDFVVFFIYKCEYMFVEYNVVIVDRVFYFVKLKYGFC